MINSMKECHSSTDCEPDFCDYSSGLFGGGYCRACEGDTESYCEIEHPPRITSCDDGYGTGRCEDTTQYDECINVCVNGEYDGILDAL